MNWHKVNVDGRQFWHYRQQLDNECGPSCVAMISRIMNHDLMDPSITRKWVAQFDQRHHESFKPDWNRDWSYITSLQFALTQLKIRSARTITGANTERYRTLLWRRTTANKPSIVRVQWSPGGGHFIVCLGRSSAHGAAKLNFLDPANDAGLMTVHEWMLIPSYNPPYSMVAGYLDKNYLVTTC